MVCFPSGCASNCNPDGFMVSEALGVGIYIGIMENKLETTGIIGGI